MSNLFITQRPTLGQTFLDRVRLTPQKVGFLHKKEGKWHELTFKALYEECRDFSIGLIQLGAKPGDRVALLSNTRVEWSKCDLAILGAKGVTVPIYPSSTYDEIQYILDHAEARFLILENAVQLEKILHIRKDGLSTLSHLEKIIVLDSQNLNFRNLLLNNRDIMDIVLTMDALKELGARADRETSKRFHENLESAKPSDIFTICYTSGTTGVPKGVILSHENMMSVLNDAAEIFGSYLKKESPRIVSFLPFSHILGRVESMATYVFGWRQAFAEDLDKIILNMQEIQPTVVFAVPRIFEKAYLKTLSLLDEGAFGQRKIYEDGLAAGKRILKNRETHRFSSPADYGRYGLAQALIFSKLRGYFGGKVKFAICGGAPLSPEVGEFFQVAGIKILEGYGLTETCGPVTVNLPDKFSFGSAGKPLPEVQIKIATDGEILIQSKKVFMGYYKNSEDTSQTLRAGWLYTGDIGTIDDDGFVHITDRKKDLIVTSGGKNVAPQKIEKLAQTLPFISNVIVCGDNRPYLTAVISLNSEAAIKFASEQQIIYSNFSELIKNPKIVGHTESILAALNEKLPSFERIKKFIIVPEDFSIQTGTLTPSLKARRTAITKKYKASIDALYQN